MKVISDTFIKPNDETFEFDDKTSNKTYHYLSPIDLAMLSTSYMQNGLLYKKPHNNYETHVFVNKLKQSFSTSLRHFYPLAGRLATKTYPDEHACWIYLDCARGPGARFIHASLDDHTISDVFDTTYVHPIVTSLFDLGEKALNHDGHTKALLSLQVTELLDGIFIGICINHSIGDGTSLSHFITTLSEIFNSIMDDNNGGQTYSMSTEPIFQPFFPDDTHGPILKLPFVEPHEFINRHDPGPLRERIFNLSRHSMLRLKAIANTNNGGNENEISSFQALSAFIWRAITRARKLDPESETNCYLTMNSRPRLSPPLPQEFFGNLTSGAHATCKVGEILGKELRWVALMLHASVNSKDDNAIRGFLREYCEAPLVWQPASNTTYFGPNFVQIVGSHRSKLYEVEFGLGNPVAIRTGYANKADGRLVAFQGREGLGSVELVVCLVPSDMSALELDHEFMSFVT